MKWKCAKTIIKIICSYVSLNNLNMQIKGGILFYFVIVF